MLNPAFTYISNIYDSKKSFCGYILNVPELIRFLKWFLVYLSYTNISFKINNLLAHS